MEHSQQIPPLSRPLTRPDGPTYGTTATDGTTATRAERQARSDWLITELGRLAAGADNPQEQARLRRTADSLIRLAIAFRS